MSRRSVTRLDAINRLVGRAEKGIASVSGLGDKVLAFQMHAANRVSPLHGSMNAIPQGATPMEVIQRDPMVRRSVKLSEGLDSAEEELSQSIQAMKNLLSEWQAAREDEDQVAASNQETIELGKKLEKLAEAIKLERRKIDSLRSIDTDRLTVETADELSAAAGNLSHYLEEQMNTLASIEGGKPGIVAAKKAIEAAADKTTEVESAIKVAAETLKAVLGTLYAVSNEISTASAEIA